MAATILNIPNSFVTFYDIITNGGRSEYITNTQCGIQVDFCYPIYDQNDLLFQTSFISTEVLTSGNIYAQIIIDGQATNLDDVTVVVEQTGTYQGLISVYNCYFSFFSSNLTSNLSDGDCFQLGLYVGYVEPRYFISNQCFKKINDKCLTSKLVYYNSSNAFGFYYNLSGTTRYNAIRLPIYFKEPLIDSTIETYERSNGVSQLISARLMKRYKGIVDNITEEAHQKINIALNHNLLRIVPENYSNVNGISFVFKNEYNNNFPEIMQNVNVWSAEFAVFETPFNNFNSNCG